MNSPKGIRKWTRKDFSPPPTGPGVEWRKIAELEIDQDLQKPVQQLVCDVHEQCINPLPQKAEGETVEQWNSERTVLQLERLVGAQKRMVSLMGRVAWEHERSSNWLVRLTWILVAMTGVLIWLTVVIIKAEKKDAPHQQRVLTQPQP